MADGLANSIQEALSAFAAQFPGRFSANSGVRGHHANTLTVVPPQIPDAVVWPETTADVQALVRLASLYRLPLIPFGAGTSLEGHVNAPRGGISVDFSRMNKVLDIRPDDMDCTVEAGVTLSQLNTELRATGLFFPVDPGAEHATLGGMAATRASGTTTVRYGSMRDNVINVTAVLASGDVVRTARRARKSASGYDLTGLLVGSEGTLGLMTELTLRLHGVPETIVSAVAAFDTTEGACRAATLAIQSGLCLARIELLDEVQLRCLNTRANLGLDEVATLFLEFHGSAANCQADVRTFETIAGGEGGRGVTSAGDPASRKLLWRARHDAFWAVKSSWPGKQVVVTDVAVPLSKLAAAVTETAADIRETQLIAPIVGHVGDGNFHAIVVVDPANAAEVARVEAFLERLVARALAYDGTATGEHGIGQGKRRFLAAEHGAAADMMRVIKRSLDPLEIRNPDKIF